MLTRPVYKALPSVPNALLPARPFLVRETTQATPPKPRLLDRVRAALRARHDSWCTEEAYVAWIKRFIFFHGTRYPAEMGATEVTRFLSSLTVDSRVAASTQNQALSALLSLSTTMIYTHVLNAGRPPCRAQQTGYSPLTWPAAFQLNHGGIGRRIMQPIPAGEDLPNRAQGAESKGSEDETRGCFPVGIRCKNSQESPYYAGQPIHWSNSS
ncbi:MAG: phage integrase N-terminal SAM-like domain-containing protein [Candidatus Rokubacteria bacterium]|nr:phage integrase N-terminal SAM-like domain-containing protein [Candidatus Rokubacteria bacterium]